MYTYIQCKAIDWDDVDATEHVCCACHTHFYGSEWRVMCRICAPQTRNKNATDFGRIDAGV